jgi:hypothetical protein
MGKFREFLKRSGSDWSAFEKWAHSGQGKRALDAYEKSLRRVEIAEAALEVWMMRHVEDEFFEAALVIKRKGVEHLQALSLGRLEKVFVAFKRDMKGR